MLFLKGVVFIRKHTVSILLRIDEDQNRRLQKKVALSGLKTTQYLRNMIDGIEIKTRPPNELPALLNQLSAIGNNINQIARAVNARKYVTRDELEKIQALLSGIWEKVKNY